MYPSPSRIAVSTAFLAAFAVAAATVLVSPADAGAGHNGADPTSARSAGPSAKKATKVELILKMNGQKTVRGPGVKGLTNSGRANVNVAVVARDSGRAKLVRGRVDKKAVRLPALSDKVRAPKAEVRVTPAGRRGSPLDPGKHDFVFGADFALDRVSDGGRRDDGDNLLQHGQFDNGPQYKIQLDKSIPTCRVKGSKGAVEVKGDRLGRARWFRIRCQRSGPTVRLRVWQIQKAGSFKLVRDESNTGAIGGVRLSRKRALSVGGRLNAQNRIPRGHTDQFNGIVDTVLVNIL